MLLTPKRSNSTRFRFVSPFSCFHLAPPSRSFYDFVAESAGERKRGEARGKGAMGEGGDSSWWQRFVDEKKEYWGERLAFLENYRKIYGRDKPLPKWSKSDVEEFIDSDPVNGPPLKLAREAAKISAVGSLVGAVSTAGFSWKYSKSPHGALLSLGFGAVVGWTFGQEIASHWFQLYKYDTMAAQLKFFDWWENKTERHS